MEGVIDIQRDHAALINATMQRLAKGGVLYFSTNLRRFKLDESIELSYQVQDITRQTLDLDFKHDVKIHHCYKIHRCTAEI